MELSLHQADENGFVNLSGIVEPYSHFTVGVSPATGQIRLTPVKVTTTAVPKVVSAGYPALTDDPIPAAGTDEAEHEDDDAPFPA